MNSARRASTSSRCWSQYFVIGMPGTYSIAKYSRPSSVVPASTMCAMFGWLIIASAWRSSSKRAITSREPVPALTIFTATRRRTGAVCSASQTSPIAPSPIFSSRSKPPMRRAVTSGDCSSAPRSCAESCARSRRSTRSRNGVSPQCSVSHAVRCPGARSMHASNSSRSVCSVTRAKSPASRCARRAMRVRRPSRA